MVPVKPSSGQIVAGVAERPGELLLIRQLRPWDTEPWWALPGGVVEPGELLQQTLIREFWEETGLRIADPTEVLFVCQYAIASGPWRGTWTTFTFRVAAPDDTPCCDDPDRLVLKARWLPLTEATGRLARLVFAPMRDPLLRYLAARDERPALWSWPAGVDQSPVTVPFAAPEPTLAPAARQ